MEQRTFEVGEMVWDCSHYNAEPRLVEILRVMPDGDGIVLVLKYEKSKAYKEGEAVTSSKNVLKEEEV